MHDKNFSRPKPEYSAKIKSGDKRTYYVDIQKSKFNDFYLVISESKKMPDSDKMLRNKIHLYKEDVHKFIIELERAVDYLKNTLMPDYDFERKDRPDREHRDHDQTID